MWHSRPPRDPPPFMANAIINFHFDFPHTSLISGNHASAFHTIWPSYLLAYIIIICNIIFRK